MSAPVSPAHRGDTSAPRRTTSLERTSDTEIVITRVLGAPPAVVFEAWTRPEFVRRWWAPASHGVRVVVCEIDLRVGGAYRYEMAQGEAERMAFYGTYQEIERPHRLVYTQIFAPFPDQPVTVTVRFEAEGEMTRMISHERYPSKQALEGALSSGMEHGLRETMDQLDALVAEGMG